MEALANSHPDETLERGFRTLVLNRTRRGGILAPGASLSRAGESGKGLASRWYPDTIVARLREISLHADRIDFRETDGMRLLEEFAGTPGSVVFADPPYTAGGKRAGRRLYTHHQIDHPRLFQLLADTATDFMLTYDHAPEIAALVDRHHLHAVQVTMKNTHHNRVGELVITSASPGVAGNLPRPPVRLRRPQRAVGQALWHSKRSVNNSEASRPVDPRARG